jgi:hypothetical protein
VRGDSEPFDNSARRFFTEQFFPYLKSHDITDVIHLGDLFDRRKHINFQILHNCREYFVEPMKDYTMHIIPGNHDVYHKNTNRVNALSLLFGDGPTNIQSPTEIVLDGRLIAMIPWITDDNRTETEAFLKKTKAKVCMGHFDIVGFKMNNRTVCEHGIDPATFKKFDLVLSGHFHHKSHGGNIHYLGTQYEHTWDDFESEKGFHVLDTDTLELEFIKNPNVMHRKLYYDDEKGVPTAKELAIYKGCLVKLVVLKKTDYAKFDGVVEKLYAVGVLDLKIVEDLTDFEDEAVDSGEVDLEDTGSILSNYIDDVDIQLDKDRLKTLMRTLFIEAQNTEII